MAELLALTALLVALARSRVGHALRDAGKEWIAPRVALGATALLTLVAVSWPDGNNYAAYRGFLYGVPLGAQAALGLALALVPGWIAAEAWLSRRRSKIAHALLASACVVWTLVHARLPVHLSAPDFDDFFVMCKFDDAAKPHWFNDKPFFTLWDYPFRVMESAAAVAPLARFTINGWFALVYVVLVGLWLERALPALLAHPRSPAVTAWLPWLAALHLGPVVLAHTVDYELACAAWILALVLALEGMRTAARCPAPLVVATLALARWLQAGGHNATAMGWMPVYVHGLIVMRQRRASRGMQAWGAGLLVSAVLDVLLRERERMADVWARDALSWSVILLLGLLPLVAAPLAWLWRRRPATWTLRRFVSLAWRRPTLAHVWLVYLSFGAAVYLLANRGLFGVPVPGFIPIPGLLDWTRAWDYATNHARYALFFYPFFVVLLALVLVPLGRLGAAALALCAVAWNTAYVTNVYLGPAGLPAEVSGFRRNSLFLEAMRALLPRLDGVSEVAYVPIPRDHGDHYLLGAVDAHRSVVNACLPSARARPDVPLLVSGHTLKVLREEHAPERLVSLAALAPRADVSLLRMGDLDPAGLDTWCARPDVDRWRDWPHQEHEP